jgi:hypothetical protein
MPRANQHGAIPPSWLDGSAGTEMLVGNRMRYRLHHQRGLLGAAAFRPEMGLQCQLIRMDSSTSSANGVDI